jgi:hypothetical protein
MSNSSVGLCALRPADRLGCRGERCCRPCICSNRFGCAGCSNRASTPTACCSGDLPVVGCAVLRVAQIARQPCKIESLQYFFPYCCRHRRRRRRRRVPSLQVERASESPERRPLESSRLGSPGGRSRLRPNRSVPARRHSSFSTCVNLPRLRRLRAPSRLRDAHWQSHQVQC